MSLTRVLLPGGRKELTSSRTEEFREETMLYTIRLVELHDSGDMMMSS